MKTMKRHQQPYACISCLHPTPNLYKQYSTKSNIKLQQCTFCSKDVDYYIEYETVLICMDVVLFRMNVFRHLLFNRRYDYDDYGSISGEDLKERSWGNSSTNGYSYYYYFIFIVVLRTILKLQGFIMMKDANLDAATVGTVGTDITIISSDYDQEEVHILQMTFFLSIISILEYILLYMGTYITIQHIIVPSLEDTTYNHSSTTNRQDDQNEKQSLSSLLPSSSSSSLQREVYLALFLPPLFHIITLLVHIYEQSSTVRILSSISIFGYMYMSVHCIVERLFVLNQLSVSGVVGHDDNDSDDHNDDHESVKNYFQSLIVFLSKHIPGWPFLIGVMMKYILPQLLIRLIFTTTSYFDGSKLFEYYYCLCNYYYKKESVWGLVYHELLLVWRAII